MSDEKPFAEAMPMEEDGYPVKIHDAAEYYCASKNTAYLDAHNITAKALSRERKAAAKALREAAFHMRSCLWPTNQVIGAAAAAMYLESRAEAVEKGEA